MEFYRFKSVTQNRNLHPVTRNAHPATRNPQPVTRNPHYISVMIIAFDLQTAVQVRHPRQF